MLCLVGGVGICWVQKPVPPCCSSAKTQTCSGVTNTWWRLTTLCRSIKMLRGVSGFGLRLDRSMRLVLKEKNNRFMTRWNKQLSLVVPTGTETVKLLLLSEGVQSLWFLVNYCVTHLAITHLISFCRILSLETWLLIKTVNWRYEIYNMNLSKVFIQTLKSFRFRI